MKCIDLHSDLLSFLAHREERSVDDPLSRCSYAHMQGGNVAIQTLALFSQTSPSSVERGEKQRAHFKKLVQDHPERFASLSSTPSSPIQLIAAVENASAFATESEPLEDVFARLRQWVDDLQKLFYITMTWDGENRFGGGVGSRAGLKSDGVELLTWVSGKRIAIDLSHTSDHLAYEILDHIDKKGLRVPVMASHSNFRAVTDRARNLPDTIAREIIARKGLIGINFFAPFIHSTDPLALAAHVAHGLSLGGEKALCFGADFFNNRIIGINFRKLFLMNIKLF